MSEPGSWNVMQNPCPINPVHAAVLRTGRVFFYSGSGNEAQPPGPSVSLNLSTGAFASQAPPAVAGASLDLFCAGQSFRSDGSLMVVGGTLQYDPFYGLNTAFLFNPGTSQWTQAPSMRTGRWYPTVVTLGNGEFFALSGLDAHGNLSQQPELYASQGGWRAFPPTSSLFPMYANLFLLSTGKLFYSGANVFGGAEPSPRLLTLPSKFNRPITEQVVPGLADAAYCNQATSVLLPPAQNQQVMIMGGGNGADMATRRVSIVDLRSSTPAYQSGPSLNIARMHLAAVLLPDCTVLVCNGSSMSEHTGSAMQGELYDPYAASPSWSLVAAPSSADRVYHSVAVLLPDGSVLTGGGNPQRGTVDNTLEIYRPAYMEQSRPVIQSAPSSVVAGGQITIQTSQASTIQWVHLIRPMATTHSCDTEQRLVDLPISASTSASLTVTVPSTRALTPVGWYMLFIVNNLRVPSVAWWIRVT